MPFSILGAFLGDRLDGFVSLLVVVVGVTVTSRFRFPLPLALYVSSPDSDSEEGGVAMSLSDGLLPLESRSSLSLSGGA